MSVNYCCNWKFNLQILKLYKKNLIGDMYYQIKNLFYRSDYRSVLSIKCLYIKKKSTIFNLCIVSITYIYNIYKKKTIIVGIHSF